MFIQTESTPNPESLKYVPGEVVLDEKYGTGMYFRQGDIEVNRSPLAKKLLKIPGVQGVFLGRTFITITKSPEIIWQVRREREGGRGGQGREGVEERRRAIILSDKRDGNASIVLSSNSRTHPSFSPSLLSCVPPSLPRI